MEPHTLNCCTIRKLVLFTLHHADTPLGLSFGRWKDLSESSAVALLTAIISGRATERETAIVGHAGIGGGSNHCGMFISKDDFDAMGITSRPLLPPAVPFVVHSEVC